MMHDIVLMLDSASSKYRESTGLIPYPIELDAIADQWDSGLRRTGHGDERAGTTVS